MRKRLLWTCAGQSGYRRCYRERRYRGQPPPETGDEWSNGKPADHHQPRILIFSSVVDAGCTTIMSRVRESSQRTHNQTHGRSNAKRRLQQPRWVGLLLGRPFFSRK